MIVSVRLRRQMTVKESAADGAKKKDETAQPTAIPGVSHNSPHQRENNDRLFFVRPVSCKRRGAQSTYATIRIIQPGPSSRQPTVLEFENAFR
jgi:hypothetical protein